jgi:hypothetical protein
MPVRKFLSCLYTHELLTMSHISRPRFFVESRIFNPVNLDGVQVSLGGEASVKGGLPGWLAIDALMSYDHLGCQVGVRRVTLFNGAVGDQAGGSAGQADFVPVDRVMAAFFQDVGVGFEDAYDLLISRQFPAQDHPLSGLFNDPLHKIQPMHEFWSQLPMLLAKMPDGLKNLGVQVLALV